ncbi:MAG: alpha/beta fold hydrolase [Myxococcales bacterium]
MKLHVEQRGEGGVPVVFHHGLGADLGVWRGQIDHLSPKRAVLALDARGHGRSPPAAEYTVDALAADLDEATAHLPPFWLVGHSFAGIVLSTFAGMRPQRLAGLVYVDAVGDFTRAPVAMRDFFRKQDEGATKERIVAAFGDMLGPLAKPHTRAQVIASVERMDPAAFAALRASMLDVPAEAYLTRFHGPKFAIEVEGTEFPFTASRLPGVPLRTIPNVSHWLMLDDPAALDAALDEVLA